MNQLHFAFKTNKRGRVPTWTALKPPATPQREAMSQTPQGESDDDKDGDKQRVSQQHNKDEHLSWGRRVPAAALRDTARRPMRTSHQKKKVINYIFTLGDRKGPPVTNWASSSRCSASASHITLFPERNVLEPHVQKVRFKKKKKKKGNSRAQSDSKRSPPEQTDTCSSRKIFIIIMIMSWGDTVDDRQTVTRSQVTKQKKKQTKQNHNCTKNCSTRLSSCLWRLGQSSSWLADSSHQHTALV